MDIGVDFYNLRWQQLTVYFGLFMAFAKRKKEWPIIIANVPGVIFGTIAAITALI